MKAPHVTSHFTAIALLLFAGIHANGERSRDERPDSDAPALDRANAAILYEKARGVLKGADKDGEPGEAFRMMEKAAEMGHLPAIAAMGYLYSSGTGTAKNDKAAVRWLRLAAEKGHDLSMLSLSRLLLSASVEDATLGMAAAQRNEEGLRWLRKAAETGDNPEAKSSYGLLLLRGDNGVTSDPKAASGWLIPAAAAGNAEAMNALGTMYQIGNGVPYDPGLAEKNFRAAAMAGHPRAMSNFGLFLDPGSQDRTRRIEALSWLMLGEQLRDAIALRVLNIKLRAAKPDEAAEARKEAGRIRRELQKRGVRP
jgi:TPR repeat protein